MSAQPAPQNLEAEESVLGAMMVAPAAIDKVRATGLDASDFYRESHGIMYRVACELHERGEPVDGVTLPAELERRGELERAGGKGRVHEIATLVPTTPNVAHYAWIVREQALRRDEQALGLEVARATQNGGLANHPDLVERLQALIAAPKDLAALQSINASLTLRIAPISEAVENAPPEPDWFLPGYVAPGAITLTSAPPKAGKTTLVFAMLAALQDGAPFLGLETRRTAALLLTEERPTTLREKCDRWNLGANVHTLLRHDAGSESWPDVVARAAEYAKQLGMGLLVVDTFAAWSGLEGEAENQSGEVLKAMRPLADAAAEGLAVLLITHDRKGGGRHGEGVRGSNALTGAVDVVVQLERSRDDAMQRVLVSESRFERTPATLAVRLTDDGFEALGDEEHARVAMERERVVAVLSELGSAKAKEVREALGEDAPSLDSVRRHLNALHEEGKVGRTQDEGARGKPVTFHSDPAIDCSAPNLLDAAINQGVGT